MERVPEPELMDDPAQARAYAEADFRDVNVAFVEAARARFGSDPAHGRVAVDLGCGPGDISERLAAACPGLRVIALDGASAMMQLARARVAGRSRVHLVHARLPAVPLREHAFDLVVSNSLVHHLPDPAPFWETVLRLLHPGGVVHVMDLRRPASVEAAQALVDEAARDESPILRRDFFASLLAAFTPDEIEAGLPPALTPLGCRVASDRHWVVSGRPSIGRDR